MTLRRQINFRILTSILIVFFLGAFLVIMQARHAIEEEISSSVNLAIQLIQWGVSESGVISMEQNQQLKKIALLKETRHLNIQIKQPSGKSIRVISDSINQEKTLAPDWFVWAVSGKQQEKTYEVTTNDEQLLQIIISANSMDEIDEAWQETKVFFAIILLLSIALFIAVNLVFKNVLGMVKTILHRLKDIANETYTRKLPHFSIDEFEQIAEAVNHLTESLAKTKQENKALTQHSLQIQEEERRILAQELHDELGQSLTAIKVLTVTGKKEPKNAEIYNSIISICDHLFDVVRSMMKNLHPMVLTELGLKASLLELVEHWHTRNPGLTIAINCPEDFSEDEQKIAIQVFRVAQEAITNTVRHAKASNMLIDIKLKEEDHRQTMFLSIEDDGLGCDATMLKSGFGLLGMQSRVKSIDGELKIISGVEQGFKIRVSIPLNKVNKVNDE